MNTELKVQLYDKLDKKKIEINWNKNPIPMTKFLSFLTVPVEISTNHLGSDTGWTLRFNNELKLEIKGGIVNGVDYLDSLQYGTKLANPYNNFVSPFYLFDIMTDEGKKFFVDYYADSIDKAIDDKKDKIAFHQRQLDFETETLGKMLEEVESLRRIASGIRS